MRCSTKSIDFVMVPYETRTVCEMFARSIAAYPICDTNSYNADDIHLIEVCIFAERSTGHLQANKYRCWIQEQGVVVMQWVG